MISARKRRDGSTAYRVRIPVFDFSSNAWKQVTIGTASTKREARALEREALTRRDAGQLVQRDPQTLAAVADAWLKSAATRLKPTTIATYRQAIEHHIVPDLGSVRVQALTSPMLEAAFARWHQAGIGGRTLQLLYLRLHQILTYAKRHGLVPTNVMDNVTKPRHTPRQHEVLDDEELAAFLTVASRDWFAPAWHLMLLEGMRRSEALGLRWRDISPDGVAVIRQTVIFDTTNGGAALIQPSTKTAASMRAIHLTDTTRQALADHREIQAARRREAGDDWTDLDLIITTRTGGPVNPSNITRKMPILLAAAGIDKHLTAHDLRHSAATAALRHGVNIRVVQDRLGHADASTTIGFYAHLVPSDAPAAAAAIDAIVKRRDDD